MKTLIKILCLSVILFISFLHGSNTVWPSKYKNIYQNDINTIVVSANMQKYYYLADNDFTTSLYLSTKFKNNISLGLSLANSKLENYWFYTGYTKYFGTSHRTYSINSSTQYFYKARSGYLNIYLNLVAFNSDFKFRNNFSIGFSQTYGDYVYNIVSLSYRFIYSIDSFRISPKISYIDYIDYGSLLSLGIDISYILFFND